MGRLGWGAVGRSTHPSFFSKYLTRVAARDPPGTHKQIDKQTNKQTDVASQLNPLTQRTQGSKYAARHPLALI